MNPQESAHKIYGLCRTKGERGITMEELVKAFEEQRNQSLEEAAKVVEGNQTIKNATGSATLRNSLAAAIRMLKEK